jgi:hypothetical protein
MFGLYHFDWRVTADQRKTDFVHTVSDSIPLTTIKDIKNHFGVSFSSVLHAIVAGVHRQMLQNRI